jgi:hypothetical protein
MAAARAPTEAPPQLTAAAAPVLAPAPPAESAAPERRCARCSAPMAGAQDWCLECGAGAPGSLGVEARGLRAGAGALAAVVLLICGAAVAAYAAWGKSSNPSRPLSSSQTRNLASNSAGAVPPGTIPGASGAGGVNGVGGLGGGALKSGAGGVLPSLRIKPPKIPLAQLTPKTAVVPATTGGSTGTKSTEATKTKTTTPTTTGGTTTKALPPAILLDPNSASTYNPYNYAASSFGDPSLAIDGDKATGWAAQVDPAVAPKMAVGVTIDLRSALHVETVKLYTTTPGMTVEIFGTNSQPLPGSITDEAWVPLSRGIVTKKKSTTIKLRDANQKFGTLLAWISAAGEKSVGTAQAPGHVGVEELELFPPAK